MTEQAEIKPLDGTSKSDSASATIETAIAGGPAKVESPQERWDRIAAAKGGVRDANGRFASTKDEQPAAETQPDVKVSDKPQSAAPDDKSATAALEGLRAPGSLKALMEKDPELAKWVLGLNRDRGEASRIAGELSKLKNSKTEPGNAATDTQASVQPAQSGNLRDLSERAAKLAETLALDEDGRKQIEGLSEPLRQEIAQVRAEGSQLREQNARLEELLSYSFAHSARSQLQGELPALKDASNYEAVREEMQELSSLPKYASIQDPFERVMQCMRDAHAIRFSGEERKRLEAKTRSQSQPTLTNLRANAKTRFAGIPEHVARMQLLGEGKSPAEVKAMLND